MKFDKEIGINLISKYNRWYRRRKCLALQRSSCGAIIPYISNLMIGIKVLSIFKDELEKDHREIIRELLDLNKFNTVKLGRHTLCWDNGVDFAPEYLHEQITIQRKIA